MQNTYGPTNNIPCEIGIYWAEYHNGQFGDRWVFGPSYRTEELDFRQDAKKLALNLLLEKSGCSLLELLSILQDIEGVARATYAEDALVNMDRVDFQEMMAVDGCFFLLVAFSILGVESLGIELKFSDNHPIFGIGCVRENMDMWLSSMFFVGNQLPFVVLKRLMNLRFFRELKMENKWKQPLELAKRAIYKLLMVTETDQEPVDLIHCLQSFLPGMKSGSHVAIPVISYNAGDEIEDIPSAKELVGLGITFEALEGEQGSGGVYYKRGFFNAVLSLPIFKVDRYTELVVECLRKYEIVQGARGIEPKSTSYLKFLSELIRTPQDVEVLYSRGVIEGRTEGLPAFLSNFHGMASCEHLHSVRRGIKEYPPPLWWKDKRLFSFISTISPILLLAVAFHANRLYNCWLL
ncbi:hypothetical protein ACH5RR_032914 [Cinchona calisaya]|uniref:Uncharacterized protein n=1 Tax=Cinchona calisaya TaxID=153742 RepID=A0ABD2YMN1_9GENT